MDERLERLSSQSHEAAGRLFVSPSNASIASDSTNRKVRTSALRRDRIENAAEIQGAATARWAALMHLRSVTTSTRRKSRRTDGRGVRLAIAIHKGRVALDLAAIGLTAPTVRCGAHALRCGQRKAVWMT